MKKGMKDRLMDEQEGMAIAKPEDAENAIMLARLHREQMLKEAKERLVEASKDQAEG